MGSMNAHDTHFRNPLSITIIIYADTALETFLYTLSFIYNIYGYQNMLIFFGSGHLTNILYRKVYIDLDNHQRHKSCSMLSFPFIPCIHSYGFLNLLRL